MSTVYAQRAPYGNAEAIEAAVEALLQELPAAARLGPQSRVLVKPNLLAKHPPEAAVTTHPQVLRGVLAALRRRGVRQVTVADSPGGPYTPGGMAAVYKGCGLDEVCAAFGAECYTACESETVPAENARLVRQFELLRPVRQADCIISLPKFKTHALTGLSGAVKNLFGLVPGMRKAEFHMRFPERAQFGQMLVDLCEAVRADIHLVDATLGMEGNGPAGGTPVQLDRLLASEDPYALDLALCHLMGMEPARVPTVAAAAAMGLCGEAIDPGQLAGEAALWEPLPGFKTPDSYLRRMDFSNRLPGPLRRLMPAITRMAAPKPAIVRAKCIGCGKCAEICPQKVISMENGKARIRLQNCIHCFCCHELCPVKAIRIRQNPVFHL